MTLIALTIIGFLVGMRAGKPDFWLLAALLGTMLSVFIFAWQAQHSWPGMFDPAFVGSISKWLIAAMLGLILGRVFFYRAAETKTKE